MRLYSEKISDIIKFNSMGCGENCGCSEEQATSTELQQSENCGCNDKECASSEQGCACESEAEKSERTGAPEHPHACC